MKDHYVDSARERALRDEMVATGRMLHEKGLIVGSVGNVSCRQSEELILVTPSGLCKGMLRADQLLVVDMAGERVGAQPASGCALEPTSELPMCRRSIGSVQTRRRSPMPIRPRRSP